MNTLSHQTRTLGWVTLLVVLGSGIPVASAEPHNPNTDWFRDTGYGVFVHYLWHIQNSKKWPYSRGKETSWDECVREFDTEKFAAQVEQTGAKYVIFTAMQLSRYLAAPNDTYCRLTGFKPGESCATRDLIEDLYQSLHKRDIALMLYWTGDGPRWDKQASDGLGGWNGKVTDTYVQNWADVAAEYSRRYGEKVSGWWVDGCYTHIGYNDRRWGILARGLKSGNPKAIIALNSPTMKVANSPTDHDDYTTGEVNAFTDIPDDRWRDGKQFHVLSYLGKRWGSHTCRYNLDYLTRYVGEATYVGGVVSIDIAIYRDGSLEPQQVELLRQLRPAVERYHETLNHRQPIPPGNVACYQRAKLLTLDGAKPLPVNGGGGKTRLAAYGVDGDRATWHQAAEQWPWTYHVALGRLHELSRVVVTFGNHYATHFQLQLSADGAAWKTVAEKADHDGSKVELTFEPAATRYLRLRGLKPDGPNQPGGQMQVVELEAYE